MTNVRSREECIGAIQNDSAWRKKEISWLSSLLDNRSPQEEEPLRRSTMLMIYAHWEGFVKQASELYFLHVNEVISRTSAPLNSHLNDVRMWKLFRQQGEHVFLKNALPFLEMRQNWPCDPRELLPLEAVDTASNLNSYILKRICAAAGVSFNRFETKENLIDKHLLKARNAIAHGEKYKVNYSDLIDAQSGVLQLISDFQDLIEDQVSGKLYLAEA